MNQVTSRTNSKRNGKSRAPAAGTPGGSTPRVSANVSEAITFIQEIAKGNLVLNFDKDHLAKDPLLAALQQMTERLVVAEERSIKVELVRTSPKDVTR